MDATTESWLDLHSSTYCPPEVLNEGYDPAITTCKRIIALIQGGDDTNDKLIFPKSPNCVHNQTGHNLGASSQNFTVQVIGKHIGEFRTYVSPEIKTCSFSNDCIDNTQTHQKMYQ